MSIIAPVGYVEMPESCMSPPGSNIPSRESVTKDDISFWLNSVIKPKYGLGNLNVSNMAGFLKDIEVNWEKLTPAHKNNVVNILVDDIFSRNYDFKKAILSKLNVSEQVQEKSKFGTEPAVKPMKSEVQSSAHGHPGSFGYSASKTQQILVVAVLSILAFLAYKHYTNSARTANLGFGFKKGLFN